MKNYKNRKHCGRWMKNYALRKHYNHGMKLIAKKVLNG